MKKHLKRGIILKIKNPNKRIFMKEKPTQFNLFNQPKEIKGEQAMRLEEEVKKAESEEADKKTVEAEAREALREDGFRTVDEENREDKAKARERIEEFKKKMGWTKEGKELL